MCFTSKAKKPNLINGHPLHSFQEIGTNGDPGLSALALVRRESKIGTDTAFVPHQMPNYAMANQWMKGHAMPPALTDVFCQVSWSGW